MGEPMTAIPDVFEAPFEPDPSRGIWPELKVKIVGPSRQVELPAELWEHLGPDVRQTITEWATARVPLRMDIVHEVHDG